MEKMKLTFPGTDNFLVQEAFKVLRTNLQFCGKDIHVIAITSCKENEGKTTISLNVAKNFADLGKKVLLIDADMRKSVMAGRNANAKNIAGLSEVLTGMNSLRECLHLTQYENLHILFSGKYPPNPVELLSGQYFATLLAETKKYYDYVIVDTPPLGMVIDAAVIAPLCDGIAIVINEKRETFKEVHGVVDQLNKTGSKVLGVIMNNIKTKQTGYYR